MNTAVAAGRPRKANTARADAVAYYNETADDFSSWSAAGNMHFGYWTTDMDLFDREAQLSQLNREVGRRLALPAGTNARFVDLGCGTGAPCRQLLTENPDWRAVGLSIVPHQVETARKLAREARLNNRSTFLCEDFRRTSFPAKRFDGAIAIESSCYGTGYSKTDFLREARRLLRPGARLVISDCFFRDDRSLGPHLETCHRHMCESWAFDTLAQLPAFEKALHEQGFVDIRIEDISMNVLPSALHVPMVTSRFLLNLLQHPGNATPARRGHAFAPIFAMLLAMSRSRIGYFLVTATQGTAHV